MTEHPAIPEDVLYGGRTYRRWPEHPDRSRRVYYRATSGPNGYLHRDIYEDNFGPIPDGWHVHHVDHDPLNNDPANLQAISPSAHAGHHGTRHPEIFVECAGCGAQFVGHRPWAKWCTAACQERARRAAGIAHVKPRKGRWSEARSCEECSTTYEAKRPWARFCSSPCRQRAYRKAVA